MRIREDCETFKYLYTLYEARDNNEYPGTEEDFQISENVFYREQQIIHCALAHPHALATTGVTPHHFDVAFCRHAWIALEMAREMIKPGRPIARPDFVSFLLQVNRADFAEGNAENFLQSVTGQAEATLEYVLRVLVPEILSKHDARIWGGRFAPLVRMVETTENMLLLASDFRRISRGVAGEPEPGRVGGSMLEINREYDPHDKTNRTLVTLGIEQFDKVLGGGHGIGELMVVGGGTGVSKSYLCQRLMRQQAKLGQPCVYISVEDPEELMQARFFADYESQLTPTDVRKKMVDPIVVDRAIRAMEAEGCDKIYFLDAKKWTVSQVCSAMRRHRYLFDIQLCIVDYLQAIQPDEPTNNQTNDTALIVAALKKTAHEIGVALVLFSQLARDEYRKGAEPDINSCKWAGEIENESEFMVMLWRDSDDVLHAKVVKCKWNKADGLRFIVHRSSTTGVIELPFEDDFEPPPDPAAARGRRQARGGTGGRGGVRPGNGNGSGNRNGGAA